MSTLATARPALRPLQKGGLALGAVLFLVPFVVGIPGLEPEAARMLSIFLVAVVFWVTEAIPLFATATLVILLEVLLLSSTAILPVREDAAPASEFFAAMANPVIMLFLGGFLIADGAAKFGLDRNLAAMFLRPFRRSGRTVILGMMLITTLLGQFMSNTATAAAMFAVVIPLLPMMPTPKARAALAMSVPVAANVGGFGTPIGTPPNAIAVGILASQGTPVSFLQWMALAYPFMLVLLTIGFLLLASWVPRNTPVTLSMTANFDRSRDAVFFYAVAGLTIALWMTEPLHGIPSHTVGFLPVVLLLSMRVMNGEDIKILDWPVLWLVAGGIALGDGVGRAGLDTWLIGLIDWSAMSAAAVIVVLTLVAVVLGNFMSNSATANLMIPLAVGFASIIDASALLLALVLALASSLGMTLPISTPPNAIAYSTGVVTLKGMALTGAVIGLLGAAILSLVMPWFWTTVGLL